jgi:hypothetical protein
VAVAALPAVPALITVWARATMPVRLDTGPVGDLRELIAMRGPGSGVRGPVGEFRPVTVSSNCGRPSFFPRLVFVAEE